MDPFIGQLLLASWNYAPKYYASCNGQVLPINQNQALFSLLGTTYGGNGMTTFALPNLQGRTPIGYGNGFTLGQMGGEETHTLLQTEVPTHIHTVSAYGAADTEVPAAALLAGSGAAVYTGATNPVTMNPGTISSAGGSQPHENRQPFLVMNWCIALQGIFPSRN